MSRSPLEFLHLETRQLHKTQLLRRDVVKNKTIDESLPCLLLEKFYRVEVRIVIPKHIPIDASDEFSTTLTDFVVRLL